jgi:hypothetical protein
MADASAVHPHYVNLAILGGWFLVCLFGAVRFFRCQWPDRVHPYARPLPLMRGGLLGR